MKFKLEYNPGENAEFDNITDIYPHINDCGKPISITYEIQDRTVQVNLVNGRFCIDGVWLEPAINEKSFVDLNEDYRPVWFKRTLESINIAGGSQTREELYFLGWQITVNGNNFKYFARIDNDGNVSLGESR